MSGIGRGASLTTFQIFFPTDINATTPSFLYHIDSVNSSVLITNEIFFAVVQLAVSFHAIH